MSVLCVGSSGSVRGKARSRGDCDASRMGDLPLVWETQHHR